MAKWTKPQTRILPDYPRKGRLGGADLFRELLGGTPKSTFSHYIIDGVVPKPDAKVGHFNAWYETTMANTLRAMEQKANPPSAA